MPARPIPARRGARARRVGEPDYFREGMRGVEKYLDILVFMIAGAIFPLLNVFLSVPLRRRYPDPAKAMAYESGELPIGDARVRFHISYYVFALLFLVFDVESLFLYPWAVVFRHLRPGLVLAEMTAFVVMLMVGLVYAWKKKVLTWV